MKIQNSLKNKSKNKNFIVKKKKKAFKNNKVINQFFMR